MSSSRSLRPWPRRCTTPHEDRRWPGPGRRRARRSYTAKFRTTPPPQPVLFSLYEEEPGGRRPEASVEPRPQERVQLHTVEHITDLSLPWCRFSMHLCRRRGNNCRTSCLSSTRSCLILSRLLKCPRSCSMMSPCAPLCVIRSWGNSWWKCRRSQGTHNNKNTIWRGSVLTGEEPPPHSGEFKTLRHTTQQPQPPTTNNNNQQQQQ